MSQPTTSAYNLFPILLAVGACGPWKMYVMYLFICDKKYTTMYTKLSPRKH